MSRAAHTLKRHPFYWLGIVLIGAGLSGCDPNWKQQLGINPETTPDKLPEVSDGPSAAPLKPGRNVIVSAVDRVGAAVVRIDTVKRVNNPLGKLFGGAPAIQQQQGQGAGFITRSDGLIFTNEHVVEGADQVSVTLPDGRSYNGKVLGGDPLTAVSYTHLTLPTICSV